MEKIFENWFAKVVMPLGQENMPNVMLHMKEAMRSAFQTAWDHQQAEIDRLMMEFCPDEMTAAQVASWEEHQRAVTGG